MIRCLVLPTLFSWRIARTPIPLSGLPSRQPDGG